MSRPLADMSAIADRFLGLVSDSCERMIVAGSIRRKRPEVRDIDIVAMPRIAVVEKPGYFAPIKTTESLLHKRIEELVAIAPSIVAPRVKPRVKSDGKTMIGASVAFIEFEGVPLDLYYASEETWWGLVQMRTGSAGFNRKLATIALSRGFRYRADGRGIVDGSGQRIDDGMSEENIFRALNMHYIPPEERNDQL